ncbi:MAG: AbrB/MazE/SpoVT family DNA-binding domain-containing protein [Bryobacteraceae bacterium]
MRHLGPQASKALLGPVTGQSVKVLSEQFNFPTCMSLVTVKNKFQVVIPQQVRKEIGVTVGDIFEAKVERGRITLTPKSVVDRAIAEGLEDVRKGRVRGPFKSVDEMIDSLKGRKGRTTPKAS